MCEKVWEMETESVCPICLKRIPGKKHQGNAGIFMEKKCPEHGEFKTLIWRDTADHYRGWNTQRCSGAETEADTPCPEGCSHCRAHRQEICCVLLELTNACNLNCPICFAQAGEGRIWSLSMEDIEKRYAYMLDNGGPYNIQLSGGEPTLRDDLPEIITLGRRMGFDYFQLNTNGLRLAEDYDYLLALKEAGLTCIYLQFDGVTEEPYRHLRGRSLLRIKEQVIENARRAQMGVVLVPTVVRGINLDQVGAILKYALINQPVVRCVHFQPASHFGRFDVDAPGLPLTIPELLRNIERQTGGQMKSEDFSGGGAENPHCSFHTRYIKEKDGHLKVIKGEGGCCSSSQSQDYVKMRWAWPEDPKCCGQKEGDALDSFLYDMAYHSLAVSGMAFQDCENLELSRLKQCYIAVAQEDALIPFCAYHLTNRRGEGLYP